jgi:hypothetical protein
MWENSLCLNLYGHSLAENEPRIADVGLRKGHRQAVNADEPPAFIRTDTLDNPGLDGNCHFFQTNKSEPKGFGRECGYRQKSARNTERVPRIVVYPIKSWPYRPDGCA